MEELDVNDNSWEQVNDTSQGTVWGWDANILVESFSASNKESLSTVCRNIEISTDGFSMPRKLTTYLY